MKDSRKAQNIFHDKDLEKSEYYQEASDGQSPAACVYSVALGQGCISNGKDLECWLHTCTLCLHGQTVISAVPNVACGKSKLSVPLCTRSGDHFIRRVVRTGFQEKVPTSWGHCA